MKVWIGNVSRKDARLQCFRINDAKSATEEPKTGKFGEQFFMTGKGIAWNLLP
jgi:hypothetical protein